MALDATKLATTVWGNNNLRVFECTLSGVASGAFDTGFNVLEHAWASPISAATFGLHIKINVSSGLTANNGDIAVSGGASGDKFYLYVVGH